jgi:AcrR family transcriptional regulator
VSVEGGPVPAAVRRRERERADARSAILAAARDLARQEGWEAVTMRRLAERIEYSANFAYRYFAGRDAILQALVRDGFVQLHGEMAAAVGSAGPAQAVRRASHAYLDFALSDPDLYQLMYGLGGVRVAPADTWAEGQAVGDLLTGLLTAAGDRNAAAHVLRLWATAHGLLALLGVGRVVLDAPHLHATLDGALDDVLRPVSPGGTTGR